MKIERLRSECIQCVIKNQLGKCPKDAPEEVKLEYMQKILKIVAEASKADSAPVFVRQIQKVQKQMFHMADEYSEIKRHFNEVMFGREADVKEKIEAAKDPLKLALQYAMVGNYIDYGAMKNVDKNYLTGLLNTASEKQIDEMQYENLKRDMAKGTKMAYLTDNCGEIVMDKLLIQVIQQLYPQLDITVIVRGKPAINDATMEDALQVGLTDVVKVIGNGNDIAGTYLEELSEEAFSVLEEADVILAKGQGNYETLRGEIKNIYYLFLCKCEMFSNMFGVPKMTGMLINERNKFLMESKYIDYNAENIQKKTSELFSEKMTEVEKAKAAFEFVRDKIPHSFDCDANVITAKASDVLKHETGICYAKANLLAALLRSQGIPTGLCFQHITHMDDDSQGYCVHAYNAVYLEDRWIKVDARGNKEGVDAHFSMNEPILAFPVREEYDEYFWRGIYAEAPAHLMEMLEEATCLQDVIDNIPDEIIEEPDIAE